MQQVKEHDYTATIDRFRDGDTVECFIRCVHCGSVTHGVLRLPGIESWEPNGADKLKARSVAKDLSIKYRGLSGPALTRGRVRDKYGRLIADILINGSSLAVQLVEAGYAWYGVGEPAPEGQRSPVLS